MAEFRFFVGVDLAFTAKHQAWVLDEDLQDLGESQFEHSGPEINGFVDWLLQTVGDVSSVVAVGVESPHGPVVESLLEHGFVVFHLNPKQLDRFRERESVAGAKDDRRDARVLARSLATDRHCFRRVEQNDPVTLQLRERSRERDELKKELRRSANRLRDQLHRYYPQALRLCPSADEPWFLQVVAAAPTPAEAKSLGPARVRRILKEARIRRLTAKEVVATLREPAPTVAPGTAKACRPHVVRLAKRIQGILSDLVQIEREADDALKSLSEPEGEKREHRDAEILLSMPGVGVRVAATVLTEASLALRARDYRMLRLVAGVGPVTQASGTRRGKYARVRMRRACSERLRQALHYWAGSAAQHDPIAKVQYRHLRAKGCSHARALRGVADRLLRILVAALRAGTLYDSELLTGHYAGLAREAA